MYRWNYRIILFGKWIFKTTQYSNLIKLLTHIIFNYSLTWFLSTVKVERTILANNNNTLTQLKENKYCTIMCVFSHPNNCTNVCKDMCRVGPSNVLIASVSLNEHILILATTNWVFLNFDTHNSIATLQSNNNVTCSVIQLPEFSNVTIAGGLCFITETNYFK